MLKRVVAVVLMAAGTLALWPPTGLGDRSAYVVPQLPPEMPSATEYGTRDALHLKFDQPLCIATPPGETQRLFVCEKSGKVVVVTDLDSTPKRDVFLDLPAVLRKKHEGTLAQKVEWGLLGMAFHPNYSENGYFFITYDFTIQEGKQKLSFDRLSRFSVAKDDPNQADPDSELPLITQLDQAPNHNGGCVKFGPDGYLYFGIGDEGGGNDQYNNARFIDKNFFAAIFRIDVDKWPGSLPPNPHAQPSKTYPSAVNPGAYAIPPDNPFINTTAHDDRALDPARIRTEIYATGLRNPWQFSYDQATGRWFIADVGQDLWEEIDLLQKGGDYGWSYYEGTHDGPRLKAKPDDVKTIAPIYEYGHHPDTPLTGKCIIGGFVYRGNEFTELAGQYLFCDHTSRHVWALSEHVGKWECRTLTDSAGPVAAFGIDPRDGGVLLADYGKGTIDRLVRKGTEGINPPALLSQTGAFSDMKSLTPTGELLAYTPKVTFWSDYAVKTRWFYLPRSAPRVQFSRDGSWTFPAGTVWVKHFEIEARRGDPTSRRRLETRFLVKTADGVYGITYRWRPDQSDADLVPEEGADETLDVQVDGQPHKQQWRYPSRSECLSCHSQVAGYALGFNTRELTWDAGGELGHVNQIGAMAKAGYFSNPPSDTKNLPLFATADDQTQSLEYRVRSYLAVNCVQCHQPGGASQGNFDARPTTSLADANLVNGLLIRNGDDPADRWAVPRDPAHSMVLKRLKGDGVPRMPPLATHELDPNAITLLTRWINQMPPVDSAGH
jgi:glucose/arabinose dehydrogenase/mono/diheme cytochrome c family protein